MRAGEGRGMAVSRGAFMNECSGGSGGGKAMPEPHGSKCGVAGLAMKGAASASAGEEVCSNIRGVLNCVEGRGV